MLFPCCVSVLPELPSTGMGGERGAAALPIARAGPAVPPALEEHGCAWRCLSPEEDLKAMSYWQSGGQRAPSEERILEGRFGVLHLSGCGFSLCQTPGFSESDFEAAVFL